MCIRDRRSAALSLQPLHISNEFCERDGLGYPSAPFKSLDFSSNSRMLLMRLAPPPGMRFVVFALTALLAVGPNFLAFAQDRLDAAPQLSSPETLDDRPLPDIATLMHQVEANQKAEEEVRKNYIFHTLETRNDLDGKGTVKKSVVSEFDVFWIDGVPVTKLVKKDGNELTPDDQEKEDRRIYDEVAKAREKKRKAALKGSETTPRGDDEISVARILELGDFSNPRRVKLYNRDTI